MNFLRDNPLSHLVRTAWDNAGDQRPRIVLYVVMSAASLGVALLEPYVIGRLMIVLQTAAAGPGMLRALGAWLTAYVSIQVVFWCLHGPSRVIERQTAFQIRVNHQMRLFNVVMALPLAWHKDNHSGVVIDRINRGVTALFDFCERSFEVIHLFSRFFGSLVILLFFHPLAGLMAAGASVAAVGVVLLFDRALIGYYKELNRRFNHVASAVHDYVSNVVTVLSLRLENNVAGEVATRLRDALPLFRRNAVLNEVKWFITTMMVYGVIAGVLYWECRRTIGAGEALLAGSFFTLFEYLRRIGDSFYGFANKYGQVVQFSANVRGAELITAAFDESLAVRAHAVLPDGWRRVDVRGLRHTYEDDRHRTHHLEDVSIDLIRGRSIALVGASGSGKSTLLAILRGLRAPRSIHVVCDGVELPFGAAHVAHHATLIPQDPEIFADSVRFNVTMGIAAADETILTSVRLARFEHVLARLPRGLDTNIAEKGVNLSGGEKQRLALARGLFFARQSDVILLDEPTSSVDFANERVIYENILAMFRDRCVVSAIHRLHLLPLFDEVIVLADGRVVERGSYTELMRAGGVLHGLWKSHLLEPAGGADGA